MQTASPLLEQLSLIMLCKCPLHLTEDRAAYKTITIKIDTAKFSFLVIVRALKKSNRSCRRCSKCHVVSSTIWANTVKESFWPRFFQDVFHFRLGYQLLLLPKTETYSFSRFRLIELIVEVTPIFYPRKNKKFFSRINYFFKVEHIRKNAGLESRPIVRGKWTFLLAE